MPNHNPNRLIKEKSPYLLQHAYNPVDWYAWNNEAFATAKKENKPIFLSIGYSTCHWCHVMEGESFEDEEVAKILNEHYVSIKVDREERPDIDHIYMAVCQAMTGQGGWPLTILMTPDQKPFYSGTYFPKESKYGRPGLINILTQIAEMWEQQHEQILQSSEKITTAMQNQQRVQDNQQHQITLSKDHLVDAFDHFSETFDHQFGGFGNEPKFPTPHQYLFLLREWKRTKEAEALEMVEQSLTAMHKGGIYDHLGYGFSRYAVDRYWLVPHFEKMLYDNALLCITYLELYQATNNTYYARITEEILAYVERVLTSPEGGFYCAEDADSEGEEGKFYVWNPIEIKEIIGDQAGDIFCEYYNVTNSGNFEGKNVLNLIQAPSLSKLAQRKDMSVEELEKVLAESRQKLFEYREQRVHPHKDDKILTSWNGLMIAALAKASAVLQKPEYAKRAIQASQFIESKLSTEQGRLLARYRDGDASFQGYIDDYAFYIWGLHELYMATGDFSYLKRATELIQAAIQLFWDQEAGAFFFNASDSEQLFVRSKEFYDSALPSGNSVMAYNLIRQYRLTGDAHMEEYFDRLVSVMASSVHHYPAGYSFFLCAMEMVTAPAQEVVLVQGNNTEEYNQMKELVQSSYLPNAVIVYKEMETEAQLNEMTPAHKDKVAIEQKSTFYLCQNFACQQPVQSTSDVSKLLKELS